MIKHIDEFTFVCRTWSNSRAWGHEVNLYQNNSWIGSARITYLNRTWESYEYQSCMRKVVRELMDSIEVEAKGTFKEVNGLSRLTKKHENEFQKYLNSKEFYSKLKSLYQNL